MNQRHFQVLYREFLFRVVDLEWLSPQGDMSKLLGQFAALLIFVSLGFTIPLLSFGSNQTPHAAQLSRAWPLEHSIIATTMLVVGIFAVLSWDSSFPDRRDVMVLAPLPVSTRAIFLAKIAASASGLGLAVGSLNGLPGILWPLALAPPSESILDVVFMPEAYRAFFAYWITMLGAGAFIFCAVLGLQGIAAELFSRPTYLRLSAFLQMGAFCLFLSVYFLQPSLATRPHLGDPNNAPLLAWLPSYWFLGLFQQLNGSMHPVMEPLAQRACKGLAIAASGAAAAYVLTYLRRLRQIVETPDITPGARTARWQPNLGSALQTAIAVFSLRTLLRSRQHRVTLAFYLGSGLAFVTFLLRAGLGRADHFLHQDETRLLFASVVVATLWIVGIRVVFSIPLALRANWIFRTTQIRPTQQYFTAIRRAVFLVAVIPPWLVAAAVFGSIWPWRLAVGHLVALGLWAVAVAYVSLCAFQKIPFTCSYLPGKSLFHMVFLGAIGAIILIGKGVEIERRALDDPARYALFWAALACAVLLARWKAMATTQSARAIVEYEEEEAPVVLSLGLYRDGILRE